MMVIMMMTMTMMVMVMEEEEEEEEEMEQPHAVEEIKELPPTANGEDDDTEFERLCVCHLFLDLRLFGQLQQKLHRARRHPLPSKVQVDAVVLRGQALAARVILQEVPQVRLLDLLHVSLKRLPRLGPGESHAARLPFPLIPLEGLWTRRHR